MSIYALTHHYNMSAQGTLFAPEFQERPSIMIEAATVEQILAPIKELFKEDHLYNGDMRLSQQVEELRTMSIEAQSAHKTQDGCTRERRCEYTNILQGVLESMEDGRDAQGMIPADMDFFSWPDYLDVMREDAMTYSEFLNNSDVCDAMIETARNVEGAQKRLWSPSGEYAAAPQAADDYYFEAASNG